MSKAARRQQTQSAASVWSNPYCPLWSQRYRIYCPDHRSQRRRNFTQKATVNNTLVQVKIPDLPWSGKALIREVQTHPWKRSSIYHLSFFSVAAQESLEVAVPLHFIGEAAGVKEGGVLDPVFTELQVQCAPENIPESIEIDVSNLQAGDSLRVQDLVLPQGVTALSEPENTVVAITAPLSVTQSEDDEVEATAAGEATEST